MTLHDPTATTTQPTPAAPLPSAAYGVHSEVGRLRKVLVCRPGLAHRRLTPTNSDDLLFDDVLWVDKAIEDHRGFTDDLRSCGVDVVELHDALAQTMDVPGARHWLLDRKVTPDKVGAAIGYVVIVGAVLGSRRLGVSASYAQYRGGFGGVPIGKSPLGRGVLLSWIALLGAYAWSFLLLRDPRSD